MVLSHIDPREQLQTKMRHPCSICSVGHLQSLLKYEHLEREKTFPEKKIIKCQNGPEIMGCQHMIQTISQELLLYLNNSILTLYILNTKKPTCLHVYVAMMDGIKSGPAQNQDEGAYPK